MEKRWNKFILLNAILFSILLSLSFVSAAGKSFDDATLITPGVYSGGILNGSSGDFYKFDLKSGDEYNLVGEFSNPGKTVGAKIRFYDSQRVEKPSLSDYNYDGYLRLNDYWSPSAEEYGAFYIRIEPYNIYYGADSYTINFSIIDISDAGSGVDAPFGFDNALKLNFGKYSGNLIAGSYGSDEKDMYKISIGKLGKIGVRLTPETEALLGITLYNENRQEINSKEGTNKGAIINLEYTSPIAQTLYISADRDFYGAAGGKYNLELTDLGKGTIQTSSSSSSSSSNYNSRNYAYQSSSSSGGGIIAFLLGFILFALLICLAMYIYCALAFMSLARKTNTEGAWMAWIPILNLYLLTKIAQVPWWYILLFFVPIVNIIIAITWWWKVAVRRGYPGWMALLLFIPLVQFVIIGVFAWGNPSSSAVPASTNEARPITTTAQSSTIPNSTSNKPTKTKKSK